MPGHEIMMYRAVVPRLTLDALAAAVDMHPDLVEGLVSYGLLDPLSVEERVLWFEVRVLRRLEKIRRLREDLGINLPGIAVVLDLLERVETLERELKRLRAG